MTNMSCDVRISSYFCAILFSFLVQSRVTNAQGIGDIFGAIGSLMGEMGAGDKCEFECSNSKYT